MKPQPDFALDEIIGILTELPREELGEGFVTVREIRRATGWSPARIRNLLGVLKEEGRLEVGKKGITYLNDETRDVAAYKLKSKEEKENE